jgi:hypothetical protein
MSTEDVERNGFREAGRQWYYRMTEMSRNADMVQVCGEMVAVYHLLMKK